MAESERQRLIKEAREVLTLNDMGNWTRPTPIGLYPHQWLWDSFFIAIGQRHLDIERAKAEIRSPFSAQWKNGMLPHIIFSGGEGYHAGPEMWHSEASPDSPDHIGTTGVTQPPMAAEAVVQVGKRLSAAERHAWYEEMYPKLVSYHLWLYRERDPDDDGLVTVILSWETGMDNLPPWMEIMHAIAASPRVKRMQQGQQAIAEAEAQRKDTKVVPAGERISTVDLHAVYDLIKLLRQYRYDAKTIMAEYPLQITDLTFNCILIRANTHLKAIADELGVELPPEILRAIQKAPAALESLWDEETGQYYCRENLSGKLIKVPAVSTLLPLYAQVLPAERTQRLVDLLQDPQEYGLPYPVPSAPASSPYFRPHRYWQGPTWVNVNWLLIDGLRLNGKSAEAADLRRRTLEMVAKGGMHEYYSPLDGSKAGAGTFSWTAAMTLDLLAEDQAIS